MWVGWFLVHFSRKSTPKCTLIGHVRPHSIDISPDDQENESSWHTWYFHQDITYECIHTFYAIADADEEEVILREKGTVESEYGNDFNYGED
jgi:hypothetical protein